MVAICLAVVAACGDDEPDPSAGSSDPSGSTSLPDSTTVSSDLSATPSTLEPPDLATVNAVLASRLRGEFPGIHDTVVTVEGDDLRIEFALGQEETPGDLRDMAALAAEELHTFAPEVLDGVDEVTAFVEGPGGVDEETFALSGELLPVD